MIPTKDQYVKVIFKNSAQADGFVEKWTDKKAVLRSPDGKTVLIIQDVTADIMAVKVFLEPMPQASICEPPIEDVDQEDDQPTSDELEDDFEEVLRETKIEEYLKAKTLIELRRLQAEQDKKIISQKIKNHLPTQVKVPSYELPRFFKK